MLRQRHVLQYSTTKAALRVAWKHQFTLGIPNTEPFPEDRNLHLPFHFPRPAQKRSSIIPNPRPFGISIVRTHCLAFSTEKMAQELLPEQMMYVPHHLFLQGHVYKPVLQDTSSFPILKCCLRVRNMHTL